MTLILALCSQIFEKIACTFDRHALITFNRLVQKKELQKKKTETPDHYCPFWRPVDDGDVFATRASPAALVPVEPKNWPCHPFMAVSMIVLQINMCHSSGYCMRSSWLTQGRQARTSSNTHQNQQQYIHNSPSPTRMCSIELKMWFHSNSKYFVSKVGWSGRGVHYSTYYTALCCTVRTNIEHEKNLDSWHLIKNWKTSALRSILEIRTYKYVQVACINTTPGTIGKRQQQ